MKESKYPYALSEEQWKEKLDPDSYYVLRKKGTERPFTGQYNMHFEDGSYSCKACGTTLFTADQKFESGCGWPSFDQSIEGTVEYVRDNSHGMIRTEILCANCGSHLGHVFDDGPTETGRRYCVNSLSLDFEKGEDQ
ncbi:peptide-methionine (R)-S-oxide reductase MsrB [Robertkochia aurantiaca]|uniref:peptide-methionine (R)-S-oxide reductase MsrB n=1 Tax=Robertkochia aurantiaca TaxID=2873700 RepID=UPI001CCFC2FB|nr:peptide-methionine (R)-S-oxide reductase MsrB [Robertkochia sp. 3YJGBD-33]